MHQLTHNEWLHNSSPIHLNLRTTPSTTQNTASRRFLYLVLVSVATLIYIPTTSAATTTTLDIPPRLQWEANYGYCGEVSLISAGLYYGQYCSQFKARSLASPGVNQNLSKSQLLLGVNAKAAATAMHLKSVEFNTANQLTTNEFLNWVKNKTLNHYPTIMGIFMNYYKFYGDTTATAGDPDYDHIVPVTALTGTAGVDSSADVVWWSDNGLWAPTNPPVYTFNSNFSAFAKSRMAANAASAPVYSLNNDKANYGIAITGVADTNGDTIPVRLATNVSYELPAMVDGSKTAPTASPIKITATVQIPNQSITYKLYMYNDFAKVPDSQFNGNAYKANKTWSIAANVGSTYSVQLNILSSAVAVFRAVRATAS